jgi:dethiobiotin synthetase
MRRDGRAIFKKALKLQDDLKLINPFYAPEPLSPHLAFRRSKIKFDKQRVKDCLKNCSSRHDIILVEGAGGLMVPLTKGYYNADLIADLKAEVSLSSPVGVGHHQSYLIDDQGSPKTQIENQSQSYYFLF